MVRYPCRRMINLTRIHAKIGMMGARLASSLAVSTPYRTAAAKASAFKRELFQIEVKRGGATIGSGTKVPLGSVVTPRTAIGDGTGFTGPVFVEGPAHVSFGPWCAIGHGLRVITTAHNIDVVNMHMPLQEQLELPSYYGSKGPVIVGGAVWIGDGVTILGGVTIGPGAVAGAGAVVAKDVRPFAVVVGNPAREIRRRFSDDVVACLTEISWWDWPLDRIHRNRSFFARLPAPGAADDLRRQVTD